ncbi:MAG: hypothetical protein ACHQET_14170, partial [Chitinophagales bacterium]
MQSSRLSSLLGTIIFSGGCWYLSCGLSGNFWALLWVAPIPLLLLSVHWSSKRTFIVALMAYLIGRLSWLPYLLSVIPVIPAIVFTLLLPLIFAIVILGTRKLMLQSHKWAAVFSFPVFFTTYEFLLFLFSRDGTAASIAYSQANCLPMIQIASVTGILGITFLVCFIPSASSCLFLFRKNKIFFYSLLALSLLVIFSTGIFGFIRISEKPDKQQEGMTVGMLTMNEKLYREPDSSLNSPRDILIARWYAGQMDRMAAEAAEIILLPEKTLDLNDSMTMSIFKQAAAGHHLMLIIGCSLGKEQLKKNMAIAISPQGEILSSYQK